MKRASTWSRALRLWLHQEVPPPWSSFVLAHAPTVAALVLRAERAGFRHASADGWHRLQRDVRALLAERA